MSRPYWHPPPRRAFEIAAARLGADLAVVCGREGPMRAPGMARSAAVWALVQRGWRMQDIRALPWTDLPTSNITQINYRVETIEALGALARFVLHKLDAEAPAEEVEAGAAPPEADALPADVIARRKRETRERLG